MWWCKFRCCKKIYRTKKHQANAFILSLKEEVFRIKRIKEHTVEKVGVLKNNKLEAVVISTDEYERLKQIEELMNNIEHKEIYNIVQDRVKTPKSDYLSIEDMAKKFNIDTKSL